MELQKELVRIFGEDLKDVFAKEEQEENYLNQKDFNNSYDRAVAGIDIATERVKKTLALAISKHRAVHHDDDTAEEQEALSAQMGSDEIEASQKSGWRD